MTATKIAPATHTTADAVANNIRAFCAVKRVTCSELARAIGMDRASAGFRWRGQREWRLSELDKVAKVLRVTVQELVSGYDEPRLAGSQLDGVSARPKGLEPPTF
ncbi:helix-turn-helix transcriptional regulator [Winkia sp. UMB3158]|uniref:HTH cro/C1-type domain-containing protein n=5 Tax=Bacillati TaxID=1783272 RepID=K0YS97_9ACTO|nr:MULTISPECIES: helix-turn-helix transcriptional regulator [Winkia]MDK8341976.1 helix-turn-helix transcriptional regulator [Winkia sp. UMB3164B]PLB80450.1 XRE family transcriptional regulator [Actinomyces sp. UMB0138]PMC94462.1 XRE family transcriptional regulator [Actinomyces sp. UMB0918]EJZ86662.1 hypothetical protein HMPREF9240_01036 [Winkia neuii BV029A5]MBS5946869.1 helix-turn-helix transcriptional regulator [Winkia neuii]